MSGIATTKPDGTGGDSQRRTPGRAALASFMGSAVEYYDFFLFGTAAALIFPKVFFPSGDDAALVMSFATFGVAYIARPVGAFVLGHFGDRIGRQPRADVHPRADGPVDLRDRLPADVRHRRLGSHPCCWWSAACCRASPPRASRRAPVR